MTTLILAVLLAAAVVALYIQGAYSSYWRARAEDLESVLKNRGSAPAFSVPEKRYLGSGFPGNEKRDLGSGFRRPETATKNPNFGSGFCDGAKVAAPTSWWVAADGPEHIRPFPDAPPFLPASLYPHPCPAD